MALPATTFQTAFVVEDIHKAIETHTGAFNAGPWFLREHGVFANQRYRGEPVETELSIAMAFSGDMLFELIQQHDDSASVYRDVIAARGYGLHHFGVGTSDYEAECAAQQARGLTRVYEAEVAHGARVGYMEGAHLPFMIEVIELKQQNREMFGWFRAAHADWRGGVDIRPLVSIAS